jgi:hypothetical protein
MRRKGKADWTKSFSILAITREDLVSLGVPRWQAALSDGEMQQLASILRSKLTDTFSAEDLETAMDVVLARRAGVHIIGEVYDNTSL